jgi:two-component system chemotaxis response regulator CheY
MSLSFSELSIVLIEPSKTQSKIIHQQLSSAGCTTIDICHDGQTALETMHQFSPDLVISAMHLPDMTATELLSTLRQNPITEDVAFMLVSSETAYRHVDPLLQSGVIATLPKPFEPEHLQKALKATTDSLGDNNLHLSSLDPEELTCLLVDDSKLARNHFKRLLNSMGIERIIEAENGQQAIEKLSESAIDFVISDYNMPEMNGRELMEYIQSSEYSYLPVLMVTSEKDGSRLNAVRQSGVCALFDKSVDSQSLKETLQKIL